MNILSLLQCLQPVISKTNPNQLSRIIQAMLSMTGRVTMLGISRWGGKGCSYRTVQRLFNTVMPCPEMFGKFFKQHLCHPEGEYILIGDISTITKSGKKTYGLDNFFSGVLNKVVKGIAVFSVSLVSIDERRSYPLQVEQVTRTETEKPAARKARQKKKSKSGAKSLRKKRGRPKGSKNRDKTQVVWTPELKRIKNMVKKQLSALKHLVSVSYLVLVVILATTMPCKWFDNVNYILSPNCATTLLCTSVLPNTLRR